MTVINMAAYALLVRVGMEYVVANVLLTAIFTPINYFAGDLLVFARGARGGAPQSTVEPSMPAVLPAVSVVIPCKASERTIRATVESFLAQEYPALAELILVGDVDDSTWTVLDDINDPRLILIEQERTPGRRDPNVKRDKGITKSSGDVIALADSDIVVDPGWIGRAVALLNGQGGGLVAGGMRSIHDTFWGRFVDNNVLAAKTPRVARPYQVTAESFGARGYKPPVTANAIFTRSLYDECPLDVTWAYGYEDYEWFWRLAKEGHAILFSSDLTAAHHHRRSFRHLVREYRQSAYGCAQFIRAHPDSPLARKRTMQAFGLPAGALAVLGLGALAAVDGYGVLVAGALAMAAVLVTGREVIRVRSFESLTYPAAGLALGGIYAASIAGSLLIPPAQRPATAPTWDPELDLPQQRRRWWHRVCWPLVAILAVQAVLSSILIWSNTASGDESLYLWAGHVELSHWLHPAQALPQFGNYKFSDYFSGAPQIWPVLGAFADTVGGLAGARLLCLVFMLAATIILYSATKRVFGYRASIAAAIAWAATESALRMGAYATFDPMAIFLICLGVWFAIQSAYRRHHGELVALSAISLVLGSITAYSYAIYIPAVIAVAVFLWAREHGWSRSVASGAWLAGCTGMLLIGLPTFLKVWQGIFLTTISRGSTFADQGSAISILDSAWSYGGIELVAAIAAGILVFASSSTISGKFLTLALAGSCLLVPLYQTFYAQTGWALDKHMACGMWLGAIVIGAGVSRIPKPPLALKWGAASIVIALFFPFFSAWYGAFGVQLGWPNETSLSAALHSLIRGVRGPSYANTDVSYMTYYTLPDSVSRIIWSTGVSLKPPGTPTRWPAYYRHVLDESHFGLVVLTFSGTVKSAEFPGEVFQGLRTPSQQQLVKVASSNSTMPGLYDFVVALDQDPNYRIAASGPYNSGFGYGAGPGTYVIWQKVANAPHKENSESSLAGMVSAAR